MEKFVLVKGNNCKLDNPVYDYPLKHNTQKAGENS